jgi:hypothetical protein
VDFETGIDERSAQDRIPQQLALIAALEKRADERPYWDLARPGSALSDDDEKLRPFQLSHLIGHCLASSIDALRTARMVMQVEAEPGKLRMPMMGIYPLVRAATESGALAVWLLQSDDPRERLLRGLMSRFSDVLHDDQAARIMLEAQPDEDKSAASLRMKGLRENAKSVRAKKIILRNLASQHDIEFDQFRTGHPGFGPIVAAAADSLGLSSSMTRGTWHALSGLSHPSVSRSMMMSELVSHGEKADVVSAKFTARPSVVGLGLDSGTAMHITALRLTAERGGDKTLEIPKIGRREGECAFA